MWQSEPLTDETITRIWAELGLPERPGAAPEPPRPCGLKELPDQPAFPLAPLSKPPPIMTPEQEAQYCDERDRAERERQELEAQVITFADLAIFPGLGE